MSWNVIKTERNSSSLQVVCHLSKKFFRKDFKSYIRAQNFEIFSR